MSLSGLPFDDIRELASNLHEPDERAVGQTQNRNAAFSSTFWKLGKQAKLAEWIAAYSGKSPAVLRPMIALFAGTHKVCEQFSDANANETLEMVTKLAAGGAPVNQVCAANDIGLKVFDLALQHPVGDISIGDALDEKGAAATIGFGMEAIAGGVDLLGLGAFGQGSDVANGALMRLVLDADINTITEALPSGTDIAEIMNRVLAHHKSTADDPLELLRRLGGREHSAIAGAILAARTNHIPVVLEGWTALVVVLLLQKLNKASCDHCCFASSLVEKNDLYSKAIGKTGLQWVLSDFGVSNDGTIAAQALSVLQSTSAVHSGTVFEDV